MKTFTILSLLALISIGCNSAARQTTNTNVASQKNVSEQKSDNSMVVSSHSTDNEKTAPAQESKTHSDVSSGGSSPMARAVDVARMTANIEKAEKIFAISLIYKNNQKDESVAAKDKLAEAYFVRAFALTDAAQYRSALGDFRKGLKLNPNNAEAKAMHDRIIDIFENSLHREPPKEGEEPPPLPFNKG